MSLLIGTTVFKVCKGWSTNSRVGHYLRVGHYSRWDIIFSKILKVGHYSGWGIIQDWDIIQMILLDIFLN